VPLLRRESFGRLRGFDETLPAREEQDFWMQAALSGCKFGMVEEVLCTFTDTPNSRGKNVANVKKAMAIILQKVFSHPKLPARVFALKNEVYARVYLRHGYHHFANCMQRLTGDGFGSGVFGAKRWP
jgi:hypothetical protein